MTAPDRLDPWAALRAATRARVALGRAGDAMPTGRTLELRAAHAAARDAVHTPLDADLLRAELAAVGVHEVLEVRSAAGDRTTYLQRPDLGRRLAEGTVLTGGTELAGGTGLPPGGCDVVLVVADGLSPLAVHAHAPALVAALLARLDGLVVRVVLAHQARVALGDPVGQALGARAVVVLVGERPGLSAADSLGAYLTWDPRPGRADSERNCVSNIRPPHGLGHDRAADVLVALLTAARELGASGVALKEEAPSLPRSAGQWSSSGPG